MIWNYEGFWQKAKLYVARAGEEGKDKPLFAFWSSLTLELLARGALAHVHPALLADPREEAGENILYAFGYGVVKNPKSIMAVTVFRRCQIVVPDFTDEDVKFCQGMADRRNAELHTGAPVFDDLPTQLWLANYYRVCEILLRSQGKTLEELFGAKEATGAREMIAALAQELRAEAQKQIGLAKAAFEALSVEEQASKRASVKVAVFFSPGYSKEATCPACGEKALLIGEAVDSTETRLENDLLVRDISVLPKSFRCHCCGLELAGHGLLHAAQMGGQFTVEMTEDPVEYYGPEFDPADYYEPDYGNC